MNQLLRLSVVALMALAADRTHPAVAQQQKQVKTGAQEGGGGDAERGRYIVEHLAMCWRCHTPGGDRGEPDRAHWLQGAPIRSPEPDFAVYAPRLAGRPPGTDEEVVNLLVTGIARTGKPPRPPMPIFKMSRKDAESILAYLKSLGK